MGVVDWLVMWQGDVFVQFEVMVSEGVEFDVVICDLFVFVLLKFVFEVGLCVYECVVKLVVLLVVLGGYLGLCLCSYVVDLMVFCNVSVCGIGCGGWWMQFLYIGQVGFDYFVLL